MYIPIEKINVGVGSGGPVNGYVNDSAFTIVGTRAPVAVSGGWDTSDLTDPSSDQSVYDNLIYGATVGLTIQGLIPYAPYTLRIICGGEGTVHSTAVSINGHSHGTISYPTTKKLAEGLYHVCADEDGMIVIVGTSGTNAIINAVILSRAENDFTQALFTGNSITITYPDNPFISPGDWRGTWGMAASRLENDYVHKLASFLPITPLVEPFYCRDWEDAHHTFDKSAYDSRFSPVPDLIVIRLGENVPAGGTLATYEADFEDLIAYHRTKAPHARIIVTGNFWPDSTKDTDQETAAKAQHVLWIPLPGLDSGANEIQVGDTLYDDDGNPYTAGSILVPHPNDAGMLAIAQQIFDNMPTPVTVPNWALSANGATATASVTGAGLYAASSAIDGVRNTQGTYGANTGWETGPAGDGASFTVDFGQSRTIVEVDVFTLADAINYSSDPTLADTFSLYGLTGYTLQYWDGAAWQTITTVTLNNKVWRQHTFSPITTTKIRLSSMTGQDADCRIVELQAWGSSELVISTSSPLPNGYLGVDYHTTLAATGASGFTGFAKISGDAGISVSSAGDVTMTAPDAGTYTFEAEVVDSLGQSATKSFTITIIDPLALPAYIAGYEVFQFCLGLQPVESVSHSVYEPELGEGGFESSTLYGPDTGRKRWKIGYPVMSGASADLKVTASNGQLMTVADYVWDIYCRSRVSGRPFIIRSPRNQQYYFVKFANPNLDYTRGMTQLYATQLELKQMRVSDVSVFDPIMLKNRPWGLFEPANYNVDAGIAINTYPYGGNDLAIVGGVTDDGDEQNSLATIRLDGSSGYLEYTSPVTIAEMLMIVKYRGSTFLNNAGLLTNIAGSWLGLVGESGETTFADQSFAARVFTYRKNGVAYDADDQQAPMNEFALVHVRWETPIELASLRIGKKGGTAATFAAVDIGDIYLFDQVNSETDILELAEHMQTIWDV